MSGTRCHVANSEAGQLSCGRGLPPGRCLVAGRVPGRRRACVGRRRACGTRLPPPFLACSLCHPAAMLPAYHPQAATRAFLSDLPPFVGGEVRSLPLPLDLPLPLPPPPPLPYP